MTNIQAVVESVTERLKKTLAPGHKGRNQSPLTTLLRQGRKVPTVDYDKRTPVREFPPPATFLNFPAPCPPWVLGQVLGPMRTDEHIKDDVLLTVVKVDGKRLGLAYGALRLDPTA